MDKRTKKKLKKLFEKIITHNEKRMEDLREAMKLLEQDKCHYRIHLKSLWEEYGEENITYDAQPGHTLKKAVKDANEKFMQVNKRNDVQADKFVHLMIDNSEYLYITHPKNKKK